MSLALSLSLSLCVSLASRTVSTHTLSLSHRAPASPANEPRGVVSVNRAALEGQLGMLDVKAAWRPTECVLCARPRTDKTGSNL